MFKNIVAWLFPLREESIDGCLAINKEMVTVQFAVRDQMVETFWGFFDLYEEELALFPEKKAELTADILRKFEETVNQANQINKSIAEICLNSMYLLGEKASIS